MNIDIENVVMNIDKFKIKYKLNFDLYFDVEVLKSP